MVFLLNLQVPCTSYPCPPRLLPHRRLSLPVSLQVLLLACIVIVPAAADGPVVGTICDDPHIVNVLFPAADLIQAPGEYHLSAQAENCHDCVWTWRIGRSDSRTPLETFTTPGSIRYPFTRGGEYAITLDIQDLAEPCAGDRVGDTYVHFLNVAPLGLGGGDNCWKPEVSLSPRHSDGYPWSTAMFTASTAESCTGCWYSFRIVQNTDEYGRATGREIPLGGNDYIEYDLQSVRHTFEEAGEYSIYATVTNPVTCPQDQYSGPGEARADYYVISTGEVRGFGGNCGDPSGVTADITQSSESSVAGSSVLPYWTAVSSTPCTGCVYTWSIFRITSDSWVPVPLNSGAYEYVTAQDGRFEHSFTEPGDYKINVKIANPASCPAPPSQLTYTSMTAIHHVTGSSGDSWQPSNPAIISPVPLDSPASPATPAQGTGQPPVTYTAVPAGTQPVATLPAGSGQQGGQEGQAAGAPARSGTDNQASGASLTGTDAAPAGSGAGPGAAAPMTPTTKTPGFAPVLAFSAGLFVLFLRRQ